MSTRWREWFVQTVQRANRRTAAQLSVVAVLMFGFGYGMVPMYRAICAALGVNVLSLAERNHVATASDVKNTQVDYSRRITVEFDANARGPWDFKPALSHVTVHPGELVTVVYDLVNTRPVATAGQAIPSYAPLQSSPYFRKLECFCFKQQALEPSETRKFPVVFVVDPKLPSEVNTITLSYTFFEVGGTVPKAGG